MSGKSIKVVVSFFIALLLVFCVYIGYEIKHRVHLSTVENLDPERYSGLWFEVVRSPNWFEKKCLYPVSARYSLSGEGLIKVENSCSGVDGRMYTSLGTATVNNGNPAILTVVFPHFLSYFISLIGPNYYVMDITKDYGYALVGSPDLKHFWILSRKPHNHDSAVIAKFLETAKSAGFRVDNVIYPLDEAKKAGIFVPAEHADSVTSAASEKTVEKSSTVPAESTGK